MTIQATIVRLLESLGSQKEVRQYLQHYAGAESPKLALIKVSGDVVDEDLDALTDALGFLCDVGIAPVVVHGASKQLHKALAAADIDALLTPGAQKEGRLVARKVIHAVNLELIDAMADKDIRARPLTSGTLRVQLNDASSLVGTVESVEITALNSAIKASQIPVVAPLGETASGHMVGVDADDVAQALAKALQPHKVVVLNREGGLINGEGERIAAINMTEDVSGVVSPHSATTQTRLNAVLALVDALPPGASVSVTSPRRLPRELFTHRGDGTLVRRGERIQRHEDFSTVDTEAMRALLERCFQRALAPDYFSAKDPCAVYVADGYRAVAVVTMEDGVPYLDKFGVTTEAQGAGVGASLWRRMKADHPQLFWRSRNINPINGWYFQQATGSFKGDAWTVFWIGVTDMTAVAGLIARALGMPATMVSHGEGET